jgi:MFS family permease
MVPASWLAVLFFLLFVAPGLLFDLLSEKRCAGIAQSGFREISRVVLASILFSAIGAVAVAVVRNVD